MKTESNERMIICWILWIDLEIQHLHNFRSLANLSKILGKFSGNDLAR